MHPKITVLVQDREWNIWVTVRDAKYIDPRIVTYLQSSVDTWGIFVDFTSPTARNWQSALKETQFALLVRVLALDFPGEWTKESPYVAKFAFPSLPSLNGDTAPRNPSPKPFRVRELEGAFVLAAATLDPAL